MSQSVSKQAHPVHPFWLCAGAAVLGFCLIAAFIKPGLPPGKSRIHQLDAQAQVHFDRAKANIPGVVEQLTTTKTMFKLVMLMARDKMSGGHQTQDYLRQVIQKPILDPCQKAAAVYGLQVDESLPGQYSGEALSATATSAAWSAGGLALDAVFYKSTITAIRHVIGHLVTRQATSLTGGAACAAADGPFPFGDAIGAVVAIGGTIWCIADLVSCRKQLRKDLTVALAQAVDDYRTQCREAVR